MKMNIIKRTKSSLMISLAIILVGIIVTVINGGLNLGIDYTGGSIVTIEFNQEYKLDDLQNALNKADAGDTSIVQSGNQAIIRLKSRPEDELSEINTKTIETLKTEYEYSNAELAGVDRVGASASKDLILNTFLSILIACVLILIYVWARFELYSGICAVLALVHDVSIMIAFVAIFRLPINSSFIAGILTIVGYSINGTILVFDRLRENRKLYSKTMNDADLINKSICDTFWRSVNTSFTTFITVLVLYIFGVDSIKEFTLPIMIGLVAGAYSSIVLAGQWWYAAKHKKI